MGAPKQKWTQEEEAALRAGVVKHGAGKWRTILKDPEFSGVLCLRSNVDLKDKWRNLSVTANGWGSRERGRLAVKKNHSVVKHDINQLAITTVPEGLSDEILDAKPLQVSHEGLQGIGSKKSQLRIEILILEAITSLKEPTGSNKTAIGEYIEDQYHSPPNFTQLLSHKLKVLTAAGKLIKVKRKYRIAPSSGCQDQIGSKPPPFEGSQKEHAKAEVKETKLLTKSQIDAELEKIRNMSALEAAAAAARAIAEAEAATEEAEEAAREAEAAEADAEAAHAFALAAMDTLKGRMYAHPPSYEIYRREEQRKVLVAVSKKDVQPVVFSLRFGDFSYGPSMIKTQG